MYKAIKRDRKLSKRAAELAHDRRHRGDGHRVSPLRIDDETKGIAADSIAAAGQHFAGELLNPRGCYICKTTTRWSTRSTTGCARPAPRTSHAKRDQGTDLTGRRALLTGGRAKIGMYIALRLLRDGAHLTITTRFPHDAVRRFAGLPDSADGSTGSRSSASTCATHPGGRAGRRRRGRRAPRRADQQRLPDRTPLSPAPTRRSSRPSGSRCPTASRCPRWSPSTGSPSCTRRRSPAPWPPPRSPTTRASRSSTPRPPTAPPR